jgi:DNA-binding NarL/FixJ family response regulator
MQTKPSVLIVEDQKLVRLGLYLIFEQRNCATVIGEAIDGRSAISEAQRLEPDIIFMDIDLPDMSGLEATRQIKTSVPKTHIIIFTSHQDAHLISAALSAGADGYCFKDTSIELIDQGVETVMAGQLWLAPPIADILIRLSDGAGKGQLKFSPIETTVLSLLRQSVGIKQIAKTLDTDLNTIVRLLRSLVSRTAIAGEE